MHEQTLRLWHWRARAARRRMRFFKKQRRPHLARRLRSSEPRDKRCPVLSKRSPYMRRRGPGSVAVMQTCEAVGGCTCAWRGIHHAFAETTQESRFQSQLWQSCSPAKCLNIASLPTSSYPSAGAAKCNCGVGSQHQRSFCPCMPRNR